MAFEHRHRVRFHQSDPAGVLFFGRVFELAESTYEELADETVRLLNEREFDQAAAKARQLVAVAPTKAYGYRCLGSALQDQGDYAGARDAYRQCVAQATEGDVYECSALIGR